MFADTLTSGEGRERLGPPQTVSGIVSRQRVLSYTPRRKLFTRLGFVVSRFEPDMLRRLLSGHILERTLMSASLALGLLHAWFGRYSMNPDGISYLDVGDAFFRHDWANAVNAWWSPLYPWTLGLVLGMVKPSARWEFPLVHLVNFAIFVAALLAFRFLLHAFLGIGGEDRAALPFRGGLAHAESGQDTRHDEPLPAWEFVLISYSVFWWLALEGETLYAVSPDLAVMACTCLTAGMLLRLRTGDTFSKFVLFGIILGIGYWTKAVLFPLGFITLGVAYLWKRSNARWRRGILISTVVFLCVCAPLISLLSLQKGRFTFGDSGKVNYAWYVAPRTFWRNWQGEVPGSGTPAHATRQLLRHPPLFEFDGPVAGTYPPWTDPSYWNEGLQWHFKLKPQLQVLAGTVTNEIRLLLRARPELVAGVIALVLLAGRIWWVGLRELWPLVAVSSAGMAVYLPLVENDRYLGGSVLVLLLTVMAAVRLRADVQKSGRSVVMAVFMVMALGTADYTVRVALNHMAIPGTGPDSAWNDVIAAEQLRRLGVVPGEKVAVIANGTGAFWARLAKVKIVAEVMDTFDGSKEFWSSPEEVRQQAYAAFVRSHAQLVVSSSPPCSEGGVTNWERIPNTSYYVHWLTPRR